MSLSSGFVIFKKNTHSSQAAMEISWYQGALASLHMSAAFLDTLVKVEKEDLEVIDLDLFKTASFCQMSMMSPVDRSEIPFKHHLGMYKIFFLMGIFWGIDGCVPDFSTDSNSLSL